MNCLIYRFDEVSGNTVSTSVMSSDIDTNSVTHYMSQVLLRSSTLDPPTYPCRVHEPPGRYNEFVKLQYARHTLNEGR